MLTRINRHRLIAAVALLLLAFAAARSVRAAEETLPPQLSDEAFWHFITDSSEAGGFFRFDNFISNEALFQHVLGRLKETTKPGGVYLGVGPDQNFTYIVALRPRIAFIVDIRRQNMLEHLMYKALIELSADRADFLSRLFARQRPENIGPESTPEELFKAFRNVPAELDLFFANLEAIKTQLKERHGFKLSAEDEASIQYIFRAFYVGGPNLTYVGPVTPRFAVRNRMPSYADLMMQNDGEGQNHSYLSSEDNFGILKDLEQRNLIVPLIGDFAGPKTIRSVGTYLKQQNAVVTAFYLSNVEQYLFQQNDDWSRFYENVATLPLDSNARFIRSVFNGYAYNLRANGYFRSDSLLASIPDLLEAFNAGKIETYYDVIRMSK
ncbi:MAG: hypothetical protein AUI45_12870 [Acidobacteria bacterium 13_1_40CM_2_56_11]|nr:MAG: hypothetical protein AUI45_12870 [Acidobacteria bacterium 13_1_40CM_2_56_11]